MFVCLHLREAQYRVLTLATMVMGLLGTVLASLYRAELVWRVLFEACRRYGVHFLVLSPVGDNLVSVSARVIALEAMEVTAGLLGVTGSCRNCNNIKQRRTTTTSSAFNSCEQINFILMCLVSGWIKV